MKLKILILFFFVSIRSTAKQLYHPELSVINNTATVTILYSGNGHTKAELMDILKKELSTKRGVSLAGTSDSVITFTIHNLYLNLKEYKNTFAGKDDCIDNAMNAGVSIVVRDNEYDVQIKNISFMPKANINSNFYREFNCSLENMVLSSEYKILSAKKSPTRYNLAGIVINNMYDLFSLSKNPKN